MIYEAVPYPFWLEQVREAKRREITDIDQQVVIALKPAIEAVLREDPLPLREDSLIVRVQRNIQNQLDRPVAIRPSDIEAALRSMRADGWMTGGVSTHRHPYWALANQHRCLVTGSFSKVFDDENGRRAVFECNHCHRGWSRNLTGQPEWRESDLSWLARYKN